MKHDPSCSECEEVSISEIKRDFIEFMKEKGLTNGTVSNCHGDKIIVKRDKHGFYLVNVSSRSTIRGDDE
jgi:hypothetical protein